jgi:A/G-specific adenine glycosylase
VSTSLQRTLLRHYASNHRDLPWRRTRDPYRIWISEVMLQQTRVATVVERYEVFLRRFPDLGTLAEAREEQVCEAWAGLGYYSRARNLHAAARQVIVGYGGHLPTAASELRKLPGIGRYTAGAIASIAFSEPVPAVDGNVERVLSRLFAIDDVAGSAPAQQRLWKIAEQLAACERPGELNQSLMELGAVICLPQAPNCAGCPVRRFCAAHAEGEPTRYPRRAARRTRRPTLALAFLWHRTRSGVWLERRPLGGLWAGLWQLPGEEGPGSRTRLERRFGTLSAHRLAELRHEITHRVVVASVYASSRAITLRRCGTLRAFADPLAAPLSTVARRAIEAAIRAGA